LRTGECVFEGTYYIETYGCQMNDQDSEKMAAILEQCGMTPVDTADRADVVIVNTCSVREKPEHKVYSALGTLKSLKQRNPSLVTIVAGCVAQQEKERLLKRVGHLDVVLGTHAIAELPEIIERVRNERVRIVRTEFLPDVASLHMPAPHRGRTPVCSFVSIMQGCSNFCSYCVVPMTRGPEVSRPQEEILHEVRGLVEQGVKEVTLLGQNVNAYGLDLDGGCSFPSLLEELDRIPGLLRIRFTTSHPKDFNERLASAMGELRSVCKHIHLPLQSGSDRILKAMKRRYTYQDYWDKVRLLRDKVPGVAITTDMIVGFPGESEEDFLRTVAALEQIRYDQIFSFKYSQRPGTAASALPDQVPQEVKIERLARVQALQEIITGEYHRAAEGTKEEVLIEGFKEGSGQPFGRTQTNKIVNLESSDGVNMGDVIAVKILRGLKHSLVGRRADKSD
jgi:tRNA-2-methylthio-N6-dimethylallyladenosine synthase